MGNDIIYYTQYWYCSVSMMIASSLILIILCSMHLYNVLRDLYTQKLMDDTNNIKFKILSILTIISIVLFTCFLTIQAIVSWSFIIKQCWFMTVTGGTMYWLAKIIMYLVFLLKLDIVYESTAYQYNETFIKLSALGIIIITVLVLPFLVITWKVDPFMYDIKIGRMNAIKCTATVNKFPLSILSLLEITLSIFFVIAFVRPIKKISKKIAQHTNEYDNDLLRVGTKTMILTSTACISSLIFMSCIAISPASGIGAIFIPSDCIINVTGLMLMTSYYSNKYFGTLCCICIKICANSVSVPRSLKKIKSNSTVSSNPTTVSKTDKNEGIEIVSS